MRTRIDHRDAARHGWWAKDGFQRYDSNRNRKRMTDTREVILGWLQEGMFTIADGQVFSRSGRQLVQRINKRRRCDHGDPRVDLVCQGKRVSVHVSHLVWMWGTNTVLPAGWEVHHRDEDCTNNDFSNLIAVHPIDHAKLHALCEEEIPF